MWYNEKGLNRRLARRENCGRRYQCAIFSKSSSSNNESISNGGDATSFITPEVFTNVAAGENGNDDSTCDASLNSLSSTTAEDGISAEKGNNNGSTCCAYLNSSSCTTTDGGIRRLSL